MPKRKLWDLEKGQQQKDHGECFLGHDQSCDWRTPPRKVSYKHTFGAPDQGQMLDVWRWHLADVNTEVAVTPGVTTSPRKDTLNTQNISIGICANLWDPTSWI